MTRPGSRRAPALFLAVLIALAPGAASAQSVDCSALRAAIDAAGDAADPAQADAALQRQRDEIVRTRDAASRTGCGDGLFDDPDAPSCRAIARRIGLLQVGLQRLQDQAFRGDPVAGTTTGAAISRPASTRDARPTAPTRAMPP